MQGRMITAAALVIVGLVWIGQGSGLIGGSSFMVGDLFWVAAGAAFVVVGAILAVSARRRSRPDV
jgi:drug/metabolite transporter (DMT)-like permease